MLYHYFKSFIINLKKNRFFYIINLTGFLTGFLLLTIVFTFVYQELSFDRFNKNAEHIYRIHSGGYGVTPMCFGEKLNGQIPEISNVVRFNKMDLTLVYNNKELNVDRCYYTDEKVFDMFSFKLITGNSNDILKAPFSIVLNKTTASKLFGDHVPVGKNIQDKNGHIYTITGVMEDIPYSSHFQAEAFVSMETLRQIGNESDFNCGSWSILTYVTLTDGSNKTETEEKINKLLKDYRMGSNNGEIPLKLEPLTKIYFDYANNKYDGSKHGNFRTVLLYFAISILTLIIVVINYINLSTAISVSRLKEFAIRKVNGAQSFQIIKQNITETLGLITLSFAIAIAFIEIFLPHISKFLILDINESNSRIQLYFYLSFIIVGIGLITRLAPGLFLSKVKAARALKNESTFRTKGFQRKLLLTLQLVVVATLLNSVFIVSKQITYLLNKDLGFNYNNVLVVRLGLNLANKTDLLKNALLQNPQIKAVSFSDGITGDGFTKKPVHIDETENLCYYYRIDPDYLNLYNIPLKYGRNFSWEVPTDFKSSCIVNEEFCKVFGIENPVNKTFNGLKIVGVVYNYNFTSLHHKTEPLILACSKNTLTMQLKIAGIRQDSIINSIKQSISNLSPDFNDDIEFLKKQIEELYRTEINLKQSFKIYAVVTLFISLIGLLGLTLFTVKKKTKETGIRKLHGARLFDTFSLLSKEQVIIVIISNLIATPITYLIMSSWLSNFEHHIQIKPSVFLVSFLITLIFNLLAISLLLFKTYNTNPIDVLKQE